MLKRPLVSRRAATLSGTCRVPGDKSISHRAVMLGLVSAGVTRIDGLLEGEDVLATVAAARALGATVARTAPGCWRVAGVGLGALAEPAAVLDMGNSGTACRLLMGLVASHSLTCFFTGDASLSQRPMDRVIAPLSRMGAAFVSRQGRLPVAVTGAAPAMPIRYALPVASAQVKSAVLLAGLNTPGETTVVETTPSRDHSERMLRGFGADIRVEETADGRAITVAGERELVATDVAVPGDPSSAAFAVVAACLVPGARVLVRDVGVNPTRTGLFDVLKEMGAKLSFENRRDVAGEPVADIRVEAAPLRGIDVPPDIAPRMIDEYPILAIAAAAAEGKTRMAGLAELRHKETDRIAAMAAGLKANGVGVAEGADSLLVEGRGIDAIAGGATVASHFDHRIAMSFAILGQIAKAPITIDDASAIATSFPGFAALIRGLGGCIEVEESDAT
ncbi:MAG: 3-phosphoshikimate 1-carboxyvinyltransferase [Alphaproteobacteria bacterium]|nr:MAG: 3-phosphoshikimate 1-carboxyvinyltransferase [Alphaproteobacteria bacterium]